MALRKTAFERFVGKGENDDSQHLLIFLQCFLTYQTRFNSNSYTFIYDFTTNPPPTHTHTNTRDLFVAGGIDPGRTAQSVQ